MHAVKGRPEEATPQRRDGRHLRSERTRASIVGALLSLADQGELAPTAQQIADTAGVAIRSIRQHFESREQLFIAAATEHARRTKDLRVDVDTAAPLLSRVAAFVKARVRELAATAPLRHAASLEEDRSPIIAKAMTLARMTRRKEVSRSFEAEIARAADPEAALDIVDLVCGARGYDALRRDHGLTEAQARTRMERLLLSALASAPASAPTR